MQYQLEQFCLNRVLPGMAIINTRGMRPRKSTSTTTDIINTLSDHHNNDTNADTDEVMTEPTMIIDDNNNTSHGSDVTLTDRDRRLLTDFLKDLEYCTEYSLYNIADDHRGLDDYYDSVTNTLIVTRFRS